MPSSYSPNKNFILQNTGEDLNTWGINLNANLSLIDENLGGTLNISVAGSSNINLTLTQAANLIHNLTGALTGNINYNFPANGGFYAINNQTTGAHTVTVTVQGGSGGILVPQGTTTTVYIDATTPAVEGFSGTNSTFTALSVGGTANAIALSQLVPSNFSLVTGVIVIFTATATNTLAGPTVNTAGTGAITVVNVSPGGLVNLPIASIVNTFPVYLYYNGTNYVMLNALYEPSPIKANSAQSVSFANLFVPYIATGAFTATIAATSTLAPYWWVEFNANAGAITIAPNAADAINVNGQTLSAGTSYTIPQGSTCKVSTDAGGNLYILYLVGTNTVANSNLAQMSANTVKVNNTNASASPSDMALSANQLLGRGSSGNISPVALGTNLSMSGTTLNSSASYFVSFLGSDVTMTTSNTYYDGPSVAQGTSGTWLATVNLTYQSTSADEGFDIKLWDGTTVFASTRAFTVLANGAQSASISAICVSPAGNIKVSVAPDQGGSLLKFNASGNSKDCSIYAIKLTP